MKKLVRNIDKLNKLLYNNIAGRDTLYTCVTELTFKRHVMSSVTGPPSGGFFLLGGVIINIYIYSDESGVFDKEHNDIFVFGGLIVLGSDKKQEWSRRYARAERTVRRKKNVDKSYELKATQITNEEKGKLFRSLNSCYKFAVVVKQDKIIKNIFNNKKSKQRYLDYAYKIAVKRAFEKLLHNDIIQASDIERLFFYVDEHTTATNGRYELKEALEQEFRFGTYNQEFSVFYPPIFKELKDVELKYCNSNSTLLVRAADIISNRVFYLAKHDKERLKNIRNFNLIYLP